MKNLNEIQLSVVNPSLNIIVNDLKHEIEEENKKYGCFEKREKFYILGSSLSFIYAFISIIYFFINLFVGDLKFHHLIMLLSATFVSYLFVNLLEQNDIKNKSAKIKKNKILEIEKYTDNIYYCRLSDNEKNFLKRHSLTKDSYVEIYKLLSSLFPSIKVQLYILPEDPSTAAQPDFVLFQPRQPYKLRVAVPWVVKPSPLAKIDGSPLL